mmetsp:Transcript_47896/g.116506  ORF Transcript_47896/g.116506 Transcript_47896/m.116506 type:complete len:93 (+) Transcript_47896:1588-1866(+)
MSAEILRREQCRIEHQLGAWSIKNLNEPISNGMVPFKLFPSMATEMTRESSLQSIRLTRSDQLLMSIGGHSQTGSGERNPTSSIQCVGPFVA